MNCSSFFNPIAAPFALLLMILYNFLQGSPDNESKFAYALALMLVAIIVRALLLPFQMKSKLGMMRQTRLNPKLEEIRKRHAANQQKMNEEIAKLYKEEGVNPASSCLWSFIQMPIMLALFYAIRQPFTLMMRVRDELWETVGEVFNTSGVLYQKLLELANEGVLAIPERLLDPDTGFYRANDFYVELYIAQDVSNHWEVFRNLGIDGLQRISFFLGSINLAEVPNFRLWEYNWSDGAWVPSLLLFFLPLISGGLQFLSAHIMRKTSPQPGMDGAQGQGSAGMIMKLMPLMSVGFGYVLPGALSFYWSIGTVLQIAQDLWLSKKYTKVLDAEDAEKEKARAQKQAEIEAKRLETERLKAEGLLAENKNTSKRKKQALEKQDKRQKAAQWEKKFSPADEDGGKDEPGRVGNRKFARGRAYDPDRYSGAGELSEDSTGEDEQTQEGTGTQGTQTTLSESAEDDIAKKSGSTSSDDDYEGIDED